MTLTPSDPRPNNRPYYIDPHCEECGADLVLADLFDDPNTPPENIWYDDWRCPKCNDGNYLDWPREMIEALRGRAFESEIGEKQDVELADFTSEGGFKILIHPDALKDIEGMDVPMDEILERFREMKQDDAPPEKEHHDELN